MIEAQGDSISCNAVVLPKGIRIQFIQIQSQNENENVKDSEYNTKSIGPGHRNFGEVIKSLELDCEWKWRESVSMNDQMRW